MGYRCRTFVKNGEAVQWRERDGSWTRLCRRCDQKRVEAVEPQHPIESSPAAGADSKPSLEAPSDTKPSPRTSTTPEPTRVPELVQAVFDFANGKGE